MECENKCGECPTEKMIQEIKECNFECEGGILDSHKGFMALVARTEKLQAELAKGEVLQDFYIEGLEKSNGQIEKLQAKLDEKQTCPRCHHEFVRKNQ